MLDSTTEQTKVAVLASSADQRNHLQTMLEKTGLQVVLSEAEGNKFLAKLKHAKADVLLIDIGDTDDSSLDLIDTISEESPLPILFNDSGTEGVNLAASGETWAIKLAEKLKGLANGHGNAQNEPIDDTPYPLVKNILPVATAQTTIKKTPAKKSTPKPAASRPKNDVTTPSEIIDMSASQLINYKKTHTNKTDLNVWVLGASLGGPQAVRQFLATIAEDLPVTFVLAQHIGANHVTLLAEQLNRVSKFTVVSGKTGYKLNHHEVILTPADKQLTFTDDGYIALRPAPPGAIYSPSIDNVMIEVAQHFGKRAGTIVFSGMGNDGAKGCEAIAEHGGIVWAQDIASCVISSMPDHARKTGTVSYTAKPDFLAKHLYEHYCLK